MKLDNYNLVFEDDFDGDQLDLKKWYYRKNGKRRCGYNSPSSVRLENGCCIITQKHMNGEYGEGWYSGMIGSVERFNKGYFEARCKCNKTDHGGFWSAFWLQSDHSYDPNISKGGIGGAEIDIMEAFCNSQGMPGVDFNIHVSGKKGSYKSLDSKKIARVNFEDCYSEFHTYSLLWDEKMYTMFIDEKEIASSNWGDCVSNVPEEIIFSLEQSDVEPNNKNLESEFLIDYIRVYSKIK